MNVLPVVHVQSPEQALEQTELALELGADGVFLINHSMHGLELLTNTFNEVTSKYTDTFIGLNYLGLSPIKGYDITRTMLDKGILHKAPSALWFDDATADEKYGITAVKALKYLQDFREKNGMKDITFYGGVSFKYTQSFSDDPVESARQASLLAPYIDVVTTSGEGTGTAPSPEKITSMKQASGVGTLAVASGISLENIGTYEPGSIDDVLIASSLETAPYSGIFIPKKLAAFIAAAKKV